MADPAQLQIRVIYDSRNRGRATVVTTKIIPVAGASRLAFLAFGSLIIASALYFGTWWRVDPFLSRVVILKTPMDLEPQQVAALFGVGPVDSQNATPDANKAPQEAPHPRWTGHAARNIIVGGALTWLTLTTIAIWLMALASGAAFGRLRPAVRSVAPMLFLLILIPLGVATWYVWKNYGMKYLPEHLRIGMGGLVVLAWALGLMIRRLRGATRFAAYMLIVASIGTAAAIYLGTQTGAMDAAQFKIPVIAAILVAESLWGWISLITSRRLA
ncbi:MAG: hypothetical protein HY287_04125 [Planctomycetes bacterium]|nr:hypothetical protein [Planctomycetota bacterium]MBI3833501.1 hypothetical protein [Planctomycetota bacterium]